MKLLFADGHCHSNPVIGMGAKTIARRFRRVGGWFMALVSLPPYHYGFNGGSLDDYIKAFNIVINEAEKAREEGLEVRVFLGFHPAEVDEYFKRGKSVEEIIDLANKVLNLVIELHKRGLVDGIGEVGRQHYSTAPSRLVVSEIIMVNALELARDNNMLVHLHLEQGGYATVESIAKITGFIGISKSKIFLHHSSIAESLWADKHGFWHTVPGKYKTLKRVFEEKIVDKMIPESDFIDDPRRPGVSSYPWDIAYNQNKLLEEHVVDEEVLYKVNVDNVVKAYAVKPP